MMLMMALNDDDDAYHVDKDDDDSINVLNDDDKNVRDDNAE
jgi:hypothetical protein